MYHSECPDRNDGCPVSSVSFIKKKGLGSDRCHTRRTGWEKLDDGWPESEEKCEERISTAIMFQTNMKYMKT